MRVLEFVCLGTVVTGCFSTFWFAWRPNANIQLISMFALFALLVLTVIAFVFALREFKRRKIRAMIPAGICVGGLFISFLIAPYVGGLMRVQSFHKHLPRYREVVRLVEKGEINATASLARIQLPDTYADLALTALAKTNAAGEAQVEFIIGGGFPAKHAGYLYVSAGSIESDPELFRRWPRHRRLEDKWFAIGD